MIQPHFALCLSVCLFLAHTHITHMQQLCESSPITFMATHYKLGVNSFDQIVFG